MKDKSSKRNSSSKALAENRLRLVVIAVLAASVAFGCAQIRKVTYPRDYVYLERKELRSKMALLGLYIRHLDDALVDTSADSDEQQQRIVDLLDKMAALTAEFGSGITTNHLVIDDHIDEFKSDVNTAIYDARAEPPNYAAAGRLIGSCLGCHKFRD